MRVAEIDSEGQMGQLAKQAVNHVFGLFARLPGSRSIQVSQ